MAAPRIRRVSSKKEMDNLIDDYITQGYAVVSQGEASALLKKKTWGTGGGHMMCLLLTVWFTFGIGNAIYAVFANQTAEEVMLKLDAAT